MSFTFALPLSFSISHFRVKLRQSRREIVPLDPHFYGFQVLTGLMTGTTGLMIVFSGLLSEDFLPIVLIFLLFPAIVKQQNRLWGLKIKNNQHLFVTKTPRFKPSAPLRRVWSVIGRDRKRHYRSITTKRSTTRL